jgi:hypothetical protein
MLSADSFKARRDQLLRSAIPKGTLASERSSWAKWVAHCARWGTHPFRDYLPAYSLAPEASQAREDLLILAASFIESSYLAMQPARRGTHPKPASAYKNWLDVSRIHQRHGLPKLDPFHLCQFVKSLTIEYKARHGFDALLERRKEPIKDAEHFHLLNLPDQVKLGPFLYTASSRFGYTWRALVAVLNHSGFRKAEWAVRSRGEATLMTFAQLAWQVDGVSFKASLSTLQRAHIRTQASSAIALLYPVPSKCDQDGTAFCNKAIPFPVDPQDLNCAGLLLLTLEELVEPHDRKAVPLFADPEGNPLLANDMDRALRDALLLHDPAVAESRSWHSYRIRLASKLRAAVTPSGVPLYSDAVIQAFVRWKSPSSLNTYARYDTAKYADILRSIQDVDISSVQYSNLPELSETERLETLAEAGPPVLHRAPCAE